MDSRLRGNDEDQGALPESSLWIPACAGMTRTKGALPESSLWIPACAGMTRTKGALPESIGGNDEDQGPPESSLWIPACAGMTGWVMRRKAFQFFEGEAKDAGKDLSVMLSRRGGRVPEPPRGLGKAVGGAGVYQ